MLDYIQTLLLILSLAKCGIPMRGSFQPSKSLAKDSTMYQSDTTKCDDKGNGVSQMSVLSTLATVSTTDVSSSDTINKSEEDLVPIQSIQRPIHTGNSFNAGDTGVEIKNKENMPIGSNKSNDPLGSLKMLQDDIKKISRDQAINLAVRFSRKGILVGKYVQKFIFKHFVDGSQSTDDEMIKSDKDINEEFIDGFEKLSKDDWLVFKSGRSKEIMDMIELNTEQQQALINVLIKALLEFKDHNKTSDSTKSNNELPANIKPLLKFYAFLIKFCLLKFELFFGIPLSDPIKVFLDDEDLTLNITEEKFYKYLEKLKPSLGDVTRILNDYVQNPKATKGDSSSEFDVQLEVMRMVNYPTSEDNEKVFSLLFEDQNASESISDTMQDTRE